MPKTKGFSFGSTSESLPIEGDELQVDNQSVSELLVEILAVLKLIDARLYIISDYELVDEGDTL